MTVVGCCYRLSTAIWKGSDVGVLKGALAAHLGKQIMCLLTMCVITLLYSMMLQVYLIVEQKVIL